MKVAQLRAVMPEGSQAVLDRRTLYNANPNLLKIIKKGHIVLDVGCGSGTITRDMIELVGEEGFVKGIDINTHFIDLAQSNYSSIRNLDFEQEDIHSFWSYLKYDLVTSARVLQWLPNPQEALIKMMGLLKKNGCLSVLDYNHEKTEFEPAIPQSMQHFYRAFLQWRSDSGMDNTMADHLPDLFQKIGLTHISIEDCSEISTPESPGFIEEISIWKKMAETSGKQLVRDGYISEEERVRAIEEYQNWMHQEATFMKLRLKAVTGYKEKRIKNSPFSS